MRIPTANVQLTGPVNLLGHEDPQGAYYLVTIVPHEGGERIYYRTKKEDAEALRDRVNALLGKSIRELLQVQREADAEWLKGKFGVGSMFHETLPQELLRRPFE